MDMTYFLIFLIAASGIGLAFSTRTRAARLARLARLNGCAFVREKETVTTPLTAGRLEFFTLFFHHFQNVFTYSDHMAYIRVADDAVYLDDKPHTKPRRMTIFTAELKDRQFPPLKAAPLNSPFAPSQYALMKTNIPAVDGRYRIHAPTPASGILFTPFITGLLKTKNNIYLELNDNALIYHEHALIAPEEMEAFRFRAMQVLGEFESLMEKLSKQDAADTATLTPKPHDEAEMRAMAMLKALCSPQNPVPQKSSGLWSGAWVFIMLAALAGMTFLAWFMLNRLPH